MTIDGHAQYLQKSQKQSSLDLGNLLLSRFKKASARRRALSILEAAIQCYATLGPEQTTYEQIARRAGVSRPLLFNYFASADEIFSKASELVQAHLLQTIDNGVCNEKHGTKKLPAFLTSIFEWSAQFADYANTLLLAQRRGFRIESARDANTGFSDSMRQRIAVLLVTTAAQNGYEIKDLELTTQRIQTVVMGALARILTEQMLNRDAFCADILSVCTGLIRVKATTKRYDN